MHGLDEVPGAQAKRMRIRGRRLAGAGGHFGRVIGVVRARAKDGAGVGDGRQKMGVGKGDPGGLRARGQRVEARQHGGPIGHHMQHGGASGVARGGGDVDDPVPDDDGGVRTGGGLDRGKRETHLNPPECDVDQRRLRATITSRLRLVTPAKLHP
jgi:hypothetical protein